MIPGVASGVPENVKIRKSRFAEFVLGTGPSGETDYFPDPYLQDPANVSKWRVESTLTTLRIVGTFPIKTMFAIGGLLLSVLLVLLALALTGTITVWIAFAGGFVPALGLAGIALSMKPMIRESKRRTKIVLQHNKMSGSLVLHGKPLDPSRIEAVERVRFTLGEGRRRKTKSSSDVGFNYTTRVHLLLRERLVDKHATHRTSMRPGVRFRVVACTNMGLKSHGHRLAQHLGVPCKQVNIGSFVFDETG